MEEIVAFGNELIGHALNGNRTAFNRLLNDNWDYVYNYITSRGAGEQDGEDITIESFAKAFEKLSSYDGTKNFRTWLVTIAKNTHIDFIRRQKKFAELYSLALLEDFQVEEEASSPEALIISEEKVKQITDAISKLRPNYRRVLELSYKDEKALSDIADIMGVSLSNAKVLLFRARNALKESIS